MEMEFPFPVLEYLQPVEQVYHSCFALDKTWVDCEESEEIIDFIIFIGEGNVFRKSNKGWASLWKGFVVPLAVDTIWSN